VENDAAGLRTATWWGLLRRGPSRDYVFARGELACLVSRSGGRIVWRAGTPLATLFLPLLWGLARVMPRVVASLHRLWLAQSWGPEPSLQSAILAAPAADNPDEGRTSPRPSMPETRRAR
jgi:hypothetical protein